MTPKVDASVKRQVLEKILERTLRPTDLLSLLPGLSYREVQDALSELLDEAIIELDSDRHLKVPSRAA